MKKLTDTTANILKEFLGTTRFGQVTNQANMITQFLEP